MTVTRIQMGILATVMTISAAVWIGVHRHNALERENQILQQRIAGLNESYGEGQMYARSQLDRAGRMAAPPSENQQIARNDANTSLSVPDSAELIQLRGEVARMRQALAEMFIPSNLARLDKEASAKIVSEAKRQGVLMTEEEFNNGFPQASWVFSGYTTPKAAMQSLLWSLSNGDVKSIHLSYSPDGWRWKLDGVWKGKSENEISNLTREFMGGIGHLALQGQLFSAHDPDRISYFLSANGPGGRQPRISIALQKVDGEWKCTGDNLVVGKPSPENTSARTGE